MTALPLVAADAVTVTVVVDNAVDMLLPGGEAVHRLSLPNAPRVASQAFEEREGPAALAAEHGFAAVVDVTAGGATRRILFDAGVSPGGAVANLDALGIPLDSIEAIVLSHGHFDHVGGMDGLIRRLGSGGLPVYVHPAVFTRRRLNLPGAGPQGLPTPSRAAFADAGFTVTEEQQPRFLVDDAVLVTGEVDRENEFEIGMPPIHEAQQPDGGWRHDPAVLDDQALVVDVRGEGLLVLSGCGHAGIVNTVQYAQRLTGQQRVKAIVGGFHLSGPYYDRTRQHVVEAIAALSPDVVLPGHCTGWKALAALGAALPHATFPSSVGTRVAL